MERKIDLAPFGFMFVYADYIFDPETPDISPYVDLHASFQPARGAVDRAMLQLEVLHNGEPIRSLPPETGREALCLEVEPLYSFEAGVYLSRARLTIWPADGTVEITLVYEASVEIGGKQRE